MDVRICFRQTRAFRLDVADHGISETKISLLQRNLANNPLLGEADAADSMIRRYRFSGHVVTYRLVDGDVLNGVAVIWLLTMRPPVKPKANLTGKAMQLLDAYLKIKGAIGGLFKGDD